MRCIYTNTPSRTHARARAHAGTPTHTHILVRAHTHLYICVRKSIWQLWSSTDVTFVQAAGNLRVRERGDRVTESQRESARACASERDRSAHIHDAIPPPPQPPNSLARARTYACTRTGKCGLKTCYHAANAKSYATAAKVLLVWSVMVSSRSSAPSSSCAYSPTFSHCELKKHLLCNHYLQYGKRPYERVVLYDHGMRPRRVIYWYSFSNQCSSQLCQPARLNQIFLAEQPFEPLAWTYSAS